MKKALLLVSVLFISVVTTACINNFAVQELNNKAKEFMDAGDYQAAIERLKSSIDLDGSVFETRYNLAVAYTKAEDYANAAAAYSEAAKLNPDFADTYYSLAVCQENLAKDIISGDIKAAADGTFEKREIEEKTSDDEANQDFELSDSDKGAVVSAINSAIGNYEKYLEKNTQAADRKDVEEKIDELKELSQKYETDGDVHS